MRRHVLAICVSIGLFAAPGAEAAVSSGNFEMRTMGDLVALCGVAPNDPYADAAIHFCHGYLVGATQFHDMVGKVYSGKVFCLPKTGQPTRDEAIDAFVEWGRAHPEDAGLTPLDGLLKWLASSYPCA